MKDLKIGFVKNYNHDKGYGFIKSYDKGDLFFHISNSNQKLFNSGDIIGFVINEMNENPSLLEALQIKLASDYTDEFRSVKGICAYERALILKGNQILFEEHMPTDYKRKTYLLNNICNHVENTNIDLLIDKYHIVVKGAGAFRAGESEYAWVCICSEWDWVNENSPLFDPEEYAPRNKQIACMKYTYDTYISDLLPSIYDTVYREKKFQSWQKTIREYKKDEKNWNMLEEKALSIDKKIKNKARKLYNKAEHKKKLEKQLKKVISKIKQNKIQEINKLLNKWDYFKHTSNAQSISVQNEL